MKQKLAILGRLLFLALVLCSISSRAGDFKNLKSCLQRGYQGLTDRDGIVAAALDADSTEVMTFGNATENQIFEIGSVTKTFTASLLAQAVDSGSIKLSEAIPSEYQKPGSVITYQHLTTHTSGIIAGIFPDFKVLNEFFPFEGLTTSVFKKLYLSTPLENSPGPIWSYSNIGSSLLGIILSEKSGRTYEQMVSEQLLIPLGMRETYFQVPNTQIDRFPQGFMVEPEGIRKTTPHWDLYMTAINPAGGIRSTIKDMALYTKANLLPDSSILKNSVTFSHQPLHLIKDPNLWIGMNWIIQGDLGLIWHNGQTYGFNSILVISRKRQQAVVAMTNTTVKKKTASGEITFDTSLQNVAFSCLK